MLRSLSFETTIFGISAPDYSHMPSFVEIRQLRKIRKIFPWSPLWFCLSTTYRTLAASRGPRPAGFLFAFGCVWDSPASLVFFVMGFTLLCCRVFGWVLPYFLSGRCLVVWSGLWARRCFAAAEKKLRRRFAAAQKKPVGKKNVAPTRSPLRQFPVAFFQLRLSQ